MKDKRNNGNIDYREIGRAHKVNPEGYNRPSNDKLKDELSDLSYQVAVESLTERPYSSPYYTNKGAGIYVDILTGEPLFLSIDQFDAGCGWPSFTKPIAKEVISYLEDGTHGMRRVEVRSRVGDAHLGHIFEDGPKASGGLRYCINGASLRFIPMSEMIEKGYGDYVQDLKKTSE
ncbi:MAG: peptide-methionine (R)-S-oxide reductase MsrB [Vallitaleaceae bacterium]|jgi:peptide methionine sulfoxide reductase msrA/msrB|nr:peptide-methionine (R)-S-oxide reductase MsrB [Vallitaleaceae bacterium]